MDKTDELLFRVFVVEAGNWYVLMRKMNKILIQGPASGEQAYGGSADTGRLAAGSPSRASGGAKAIWGHLPNSHKCRTYGDFPGGPVVGTLRFHCKGHGFDPWSGN